MDDDGRINANLNQVWKACRKIQDAIYRYGFDLCAEFCPHDPNNKGLISESLFTAILGKYKSIAGLSDFELREITDYFRLRDGRVVYKEFCDVVLDNKHNKAATKDLATGLEWNDPMHLNVLHTPEDRRQLCLILIKIAQFSHLPLRPYFQDYELISNNKGTVTVSHFSRVLHFLKIPLSDNDYLLLMKRYMKDSYLVNYMAFIQHIENILAYLKDSKLTDNSMEIYKNFPGKIIDLDLPVLPPVDDTNIAQRIFKDFCNHPRPDKLDCEVVACIQKQVHKNRIRVREFLEGFDLLHTGTITINQFERGLFNMGIGKYLTQKDMKILANRYRCPIDSNRIKWRHFEDEIDSVFTVKHLDKAPLVSFSSPPKHVEEMLRPGEIPWHEVSEEKRDFCAEALSKIQIRIRNRRLYLQPFFRSYDKLNSGHVPCKVANQILFTNGILLDNDELNALIDRFGNELGFCYTKFLVHADPAEYAVPSYKATSSLAENCPTKKQSGDGKTVGDIDEEIIIKTLTKAKRQAVTRNIPIIDFLQDYDRHREGEILEADFKRGLDSADIKMEPNELDVLCKIFRSPKRACCVLYRNFCQSLDEIFVKVETETGDGEVTAVPLMHLANLDCVDCFLNFEERTICSQALMKLARKPDEISNLKSVFKDFDRESCGTIQKNHLMRALSVREMHNMISSREFDVVFKCFAVKRGIDLEFKYREFLNVLDILFRNGQIKRNY